MSFPSLALLHRFTRFVSTSGKLFCKLEQLMSVQVLHLVFELLAIKASNHDQIVAGLRSGQDILLLVIDLREAERRAWNFRAGFDHCGFSHCSWRLWHRQIRIRQCR